MRTSTQFSMWVLPLFLLLAWGFVSCHSKSVEGEKLAKTYCASCHLLPSPSLLPKNVWKYSTLPYMGILMGIHDEIKNLPQPLKNYAMLSPHAQSIPNEDWEKIKAYYLSTAPKELVQSQRDTLTELKGLFKLEDLNLEGRNETIPNFTSVKIDEKNHRIFAGDQSNRIIWQLGSDGSYQQKWVDQNALTSIEINHAKSSSFYFTFIGTTTQANPNVNGSVDLISKSKSKNFEFHPILSGLNRPIDLVAANLDDNLDEELITCEFGFKEGGLAIWKSQSNGLWLKKVLNAQTGATRSIVRDFNADGKMDILTLFAQGDERIILYENQGHLNFKERVILRFPSIHGTSSFDAADIDGDGDLDVLCTAGDNADFSTIFKPYHGLYVYKNDGNFTFKLASFFPQNGSTKVLARDFDQDGDQDMVSIALFPDVKKRPLEGFIYFENRGNSFYQKTLPINHLGRWSVMDAGDVDGDGDLDLVLGSHAVAKFATGGFDPAWKQAKGILILRNELK